jgi:hypothetical protein
MKATFDKVRSKVSLRRASEADSVPERSLHNRLMKRNKGGKCDTFARHGCIHNYIF